MFAKDRLSMYFYAAHSFHLFHAVEGIAVLLLASLSVWRRNIERDTNNFS